MKQVVLQSIFPNQPVMDNWFLVSVISNYTYLAQCIQFSVFTFHA